MNAKPSNTETKSLNLGLLHELIAEASEQGAKRALARLGLDDTAASKDMAELR